MKRLIFICIILSNFHFAFGQCLNEKGALLINEFSNGPSGKNQEFIELIVIGAPDNPTFPVDLTGWIIDDNNQPAIDVGNEPGHIRLGSCFNNVSPGTLLVIYNDVDVHPNIDFSSAMVVPFSDPCIIKMEDCPSHTISDYDCAVQSSGIWTDFIPAKNWGDKMQVLNPSEKYVDGFEWGLPQQSSSASRTGQAYINMAQSSFLWKSFFDATPGQANSAENQSFIDLIISGGQLYIPLEVECTLLNGSTGINDGEIGINTSGGTGPYVYILSGEWEETLTTDETEISFDKLICGEWTITVTDKNGCTVTCSTQVSSSGTSTFNINSGQCIDLVCEDCLSSESDNQCYRWFPSGIFANPDSPFQTVCPSENSNYSVTVSDNNGQLVAICNFEINIVIDSDQDGINDNLDCAPFDPYKYEGAPCDDNDPCTKNDSYDEECNCKGELVNPDCDANNCIVGAPCDDSNYCTQDDRFDENCNCEGVYINDCSWCDVGSLCDDNNPCTSNDRIRFGCQCEGDIIPNCSPCVENTPCDDNNPCTENDVYNLDCECIGTPIESCIPCAPGSPCDDGDYCTENDEFDSNCNCEGTLIPECNPCTVDAPCDDNNSCTINDIVQSDCSCMGTIINPGSPCNDENDCTQNDLYNFDCECVGESILDFEIIVDQNTNECENTPKILRTSQEFSDYRWMYEGVSFSYNAEVVVTQAGNYTVEVFTNEECFGAATTTIIDYDADNIDIQASNPSICNSNEPVELSINQVYDNAAWYDEYNTMISNTSNLIKVYAPGLYRVEVEVNGCVLKGTIEVLSSIDDNLEIEPQNPVLCNSIVLRVEGASQTYNYKWSTGQTDSFIETGTSGYYTVTVSDDQNCIEILEIEVIDNDDIQSIEDILTTNGFYCKPITILTDPGIIDPDIEFKSSGICGENFDDSQLNLGQIKVLYEGQEVIINDLLRNKVSNACQCDGEQSFGGVLMDDFCADPERDLDYFIDYEDQFDAVVQAFLIRGESGNDCLWIKDRIGTECNYNQHSKPEEFINLFNSIACVYHENASEIILPDIGLNYPYNSWQSGTVTLFNNTSYQGLVHASFERGFLIQNYYKYEALDVTEENGNSNIFFGKETQVCFPGLGGFVNFILDGPFAIISIPYESDCFDPLKIIYKLEDQDEIEGLIKNGRQLAEEAYIQLDIDLLELIPTCLLSGVEVCQLLSANANDPSKNDLMLHLLEANSKNSATDIIHCLEDKADESNPEDYNPLVEDLYASMMGGNKQKMLKQCVNLFNLTANYDFEYVVDDEFFRLEEKGIILKEQWYTSDLMELEVDVHKHNRFIYSSLPPLFFTITKDTSFKHFSAYPVYLQGQFNALPANPDEKVNTVVPGIYMHYAIKHEAIKDRSELAWAIVDLAGTYFGWTEFKAATKALRFKRLRQTLGLAETVVAPAHLLLSNESICATIAGMDTFCDEWRPVTEYINIILLSGILVPSISKKMNTAKIEWDKIKESKKAEIEEKFGEDYYSKLDNFINSYKGLLELLKEKYPQLAQVYPEKIASLVNENEFAYRLLDDDIAVLINESMDINKQARLFEDLIDNLGNPNSFSGALKSLQPGDFKAWDFFYDALGTNSRFGRDALSLKKLSGIIEDGSAFRNKVGDNWKTELEEILQTNNDLRCKTCIGNNGGILGRPYRSEMHEFLNEVDHFVETFEIANPTKGKKFYNLLRGLSLDETPNGNILFYEELHQAIYYLKKHPEINSNTLENFGGVIGNTTKKGDVIKAQISGNPKYIELKSLLKGNGPDDDLDVLSGLFSNPLKNRTQFYEQLKNGYLKTIESLDELIYSFDARKLGEGGEAFIKGQFKDLLIAKADDLYKPILQGGLGAEKINSLFGVENFNEFLQVLNDFDANPELSKFIKVE